MLFRIKLLRDALPEFKNSGRFIALLENVESDPNADDIILKIDDRLPESVFDFFYAFFGDETDKKLLEIMRYKNDLNNATWNCIIKIPRRL